MNKWQPIETAPKDGTWIRLFRPLATVGTWQCEIIGKWHTFEEGDSAWVWPCDTYDVYFRQASADMAIDKGDFYEDTEHFTHWMPLPEPPEQEDGK